MTKRIRMIIAIVLCAALLLGALAVYAADSSKQSGAAVQSGRVDETGNPAADSARVDESEDPAADSARVDESVNGNASRIDEAKKSLLPEGVTETPHTGRDKHLLDIQLRLVLWLGEYDFRFARNYA